MGSKGNGSITSKGVEAGLAVNITLLLKWDPIENRFFGETITVTGLLTGQDIAAGLKGKELGEQLLLSESMLRDNTNVFLDDMTKEELEEALGVGIQTVQGDGYDFLMAVLGITEEENG